MRDGYKIGPFSRHRDAPGDGVEKVGIEVPLGETVTLEGAGDDDAALEEVISLAQAPLPDEEDVVASADESRPSWVVDDPHDFVDEMIERFDLALDDAALVANMIARLARRP